MIDKTVQSFDLRLIEWAEKPENRIFWPLSAVAIILTMFVFGSTTVLVYPFKVIAEIWRRLWRK